MNFLFKKQTMIIIIIIALLSVGSFSFYLYQKNKTTTLLLELEMARIADLTPKQEIIGSSIEKRNIEAFTFGNGEKHLLFVGGIHGGYEWNTSLLAYEMMDYLEANPNTIPNNVKVTIIPVLNPDGLNKTVGTSSNFKSTDVPPTIAETISGRFNANKVDLNRNFDCNWKSTGIWQNKTVDPGSKAFSEPESQAIRNYIDVQKPQAVVVWYSSAGGIYTSNCNGTVLTETKTLAKIFAEASKYPNQGEFTSYEINGDMVNWLAKENIPAISVLLTDHTNTEKNKNQAGLEAVLKHYSN